MRTTSASHKKRRRRRVRIITVSLLGVAALATVLALGLMARELLTAVHTPSISREGPAYTASDGATAAPGESEHPPAQFSSPSRPRPPLPKSVPLIMQNDAPDPLPTGCEATSAAMLLQAYGYDFSKAAVANALPKGPITKVGGERYGPDPNEMFVGNPEGRGLDFGVYSKPMGETMQELIDAAGGGSKVRLLTGGTPADILEQLDMGRPVLIWVTMGMAKTKPGYQWKLIKNGVYTDELFTWKGNEHCVVLTGYTKNKVSISDPLKGEWSPGRDLLFTRWEEQGKHALILE